MLGGYLAASGPLSTMAQYAVGGVSGPASAQPSGIGKLIVGAPGSPRCTGVAVILLSLKYVAMVGLGPSGAIRGATLDCGFLTVDEVVDGALLELLLGAFFCWLGSV